MKKVAFAVILLAVVAGIAYFLTQKGSPQVVVQMSPQPTISDNSQSSTSSADLLEGGSALEVQDQKVTKQVKIALVVLDRSGFVVIHRATPEGKPGDVIGHSELLSSGQHEDLLVDLDTGKTVKAGDTLVAMLHADADGDLAYTATDEGLPLKDSEGNVVMMKFVASVAQPPVASP